MLTLPKIHVRSDRGLAFVYLGKKKVYLGRPGSVETEEKYLDLLRELQEGKRVSSSEKKSLEPPLAENTKNPSLEGNGVVVQPARTDVTVDDLFSRFMQVCGPLIDQSDRRRIMNIWKWINEWFPGILCDDFDSVILDEFRDRMRSKGYHKGSLEKEYLYDYIEKVKGALIRVFRWGVKKKLVRSEILFDLKQLGVASKSGMKPKKRNPRRVSDEEFEAVLSFLSPLWQDFFRIQYLCGMRTKETTGVNWDEIVIEPKKVVWFFEPLEHKNAWRGQDRHIGIDPEAQAILRKYEGKAGYIWTPREMRAEELGIDPKSDDKRLALCKKPRLQTEKADRVFSAAVKKAIAAGKIKRVIHPYDLRKKAGTEAGLKYGPKGFQYKMGHKHIDTQTFYDQGEMDMLEMMGEDRLPKQNARKKRCKNNKDNNNDTNQQ